MTVEELITELQKYDSKRTVMITTGGLIEHINKETIYEDIFGIIIIKSDKEFLIRNEIT